MLTIRIDHAADSRSKLRADKGINVPDTRLPIPALTTKDVADLSVVAELADLVEMSFVREPSDVEQLLDEMGRLGAEHLGIVLKIETRKGFEHLPQLLLTVMRHPRAGVTIARGDLAVECGYDRLAELQEEILWLCESAHLPTIWATQVLEQLAKTGKPSRAEISDAAMSERAECVMLNKGPYIDDAVVALDDILRRMAGHLHKRSGLLRTLHSWRPSQNQAGAHPASPAGGGRDVDRYETRFASWDLDAMSPRWVRLRLSLRLDGRDCARSGSGADVDALFGRLGLCQAHRDGQDAVAVGDADVLLV